MRAFLLLVFSITAIGSHSQEAMRVERCTAVSPDAAVFNIYVDQDDNKWVTNSEGLFQVHAADLSTPKEIPGGKESLLTIPDGNKDLRWPKGELNSLLDGALSGSNEITCGFYNEVQDHLWIGTSDGLFMFRTQPKLKWVKEVNRRMPKLRSSRINTIYVDGDDDRHFFGTEEGVLVGRGGRWGLEERYFRFQAITRRGKNIWLLAEDLIWIVNENDDWRSIEINQEYVEGEIKDIAFDKDGRLWIASEYLTMYDVDRESYRIFDGADYFTSSNVNCLAVDRTGAVWVGTQDKGLYIIEKESAMTVTCLVENELSCVPGENNGALIVKIKGGQPPYQYKWDDDLVGDNPTDLGPGKYVVTVTDSKGQSKAAEGTIADSRIHLTIAAEQPATPDGNSKGSAVASLEGGKPKFTYQWDNGESGPRAENLTAGQHNLTVTDANGCKAEGSVEISQEILALAVKLERTGVSKCKGDGGNQVQAKVTGGLTPYTYQWSNSKDLNAEATGLESGLHYVSVTDAAGKTASTSINIEEIDALEITASVNASASTGNNDGSASVMAKGGSGKYKYAWDNGEDGRQAKNLSVGLHKVTVTDASGCTAEGSVEISEEILELAVNLQRMGISKCKGDGGNAVQAVVRGGVSPYTYSWSQSQEDKPEISGIGAGVHRLMVTDASGETVSSSINIEEIEALEITASVNAAASTGNEDGRASVTAKGGSGKYIYAWDNGESTKSASNLSPGEHKVTVTDEEGCSQEATVEISEDISELSVVINTTSEIECHGDQGGTIEAQIRGGKGPFTFTWNQPGLDGERAANLQSGDYKVTVTDVVGNEASASVTLDEPEELVVEVVEQRGVTDEASSDGKAELAVEGGRGNYTYQWDNQYSGEKVENLSLGSHSVTVTDGNGCSVIKEFETKQKILPQLSLSKLRTGQVVQMQMLQFDADSTSLNEGAKPILDEVYQFLKDNPAVVIRVEGHTNNIPPDAFCDKLSTARAKSVAEYVVQQGIADERVYYKGYGKRNPIYSNKTAEGRKKNQRVEINILKVKEDGS